MKRAESLTYLTVLAAFSLVSIYYVGIGIIEKEVSTLEEPFLNLGENESYKSYQPEAEVEIHSPISSAVKIIVENQFSHDLNLYYNTLQTSPMRIGKIISKGSLQINTFIGHSFYATLGEPELKHVAELEVQRNVSHYMLSPTSHHSSDSTYCTQNDTEVRTRMHPAVKFLDKGRSTSVNARFRCMSSRILDLYYDDGKTGSYLATVRMGQDTSSASYEGHKFFYTPRGDINNVLGRLEVKRDQVLYLLVDENFPPSQEVSDRLTAELNFMSEYKNRTGIQWRSYYGPDGPRPPPKLYMWDADEIGQVHRVTSSHGKWLCEGPANECQSTEELHLELEVISQEPRAFIIPNLLSDFECDSIVKMGQPQLHRSLVGDGGSASAISSTRSSRNTWVNRRKSEVTETLTLRTADLLRIDEKLLNMNENAEELQVLHYAVGQKYDPHHDWAAAENANQRFITILFYLNNMKHENAGGETAFPKAAGGRGVKVHPGKGSAVLFYSMLPDGNADDLSLHEATPVRDGEKWLANYWIWDPKRS